MLQDVRESGKPSGKVARKRTPSSQRLAREAIQERVEHKGHDHRSAKGRGGV